MLALPPLLTQTFQTAVCSNFLLVPGSFIQRAVVW